MAGRPDIELCEASTDLFESNADGKPVTRSVRAWIPERFCSVEVATEGEGTVLRMVPDWLAQFTQQKESAGSCMLLG